MKFWGKKIIIIVLVGLMLCIFAALRDEYYLSVQSADDDSVSPGLFSIDSVQSKLACIGGAIIAFCSITAIFIREQNYRKAIFFIISFIMACKVFIIEFSRISL